MTIFIILFCVFLLLLAISAFVLSIDGIKKNSQCKDLDGMLRSYIRKHRGTFGVSNHGISMDSVDEIQIISPKNMGL